jgi:hypothetical protein
MKTERRIGSRDHGAGCLLNPPVAFRGRTISQDNHIIWNTIYRFLRGPPRLLGIPGCLIIGDSNDEGRSEGEINAVLSH